MPAGVVITTRNVIENVRPGFGRLLRTAGTARQTTFVSWLPFYHDMGLIMAVCAPPGAGARGADESAGVPAAARPLDAAAGEEPRVLFGRTELRVRTGGTPNVRRRHGGARSRRCAGITAAPSAFTPPRSALHRPVRPFNLKDIGDPAVLWARRGHGLRRVLESRRAARRSCGSTTRSCRAAMPGGARARRRQHRVGRSRHAARHRRCGSSTPRPGARTPPDQVGEIWVHGDNVATGTGGTRGKASACSAASSSIRPPGTPEGPWLRTGDLGVISEGELFIIGRIKDLLIVDGRNHYPDDIEATIQEISRGASPPSRSRPMRPRSSSRSSRSRSAAAPTRTRSERLRALKREITSAVSTYSPPAGCRSRLRAAGFPSDHHQREDSAVRCAELYRRNEFERMEATS